MWIESPKKQNVEQIKHALNLALEALEQWYDKNNMKVNVYKTVAASFCLTYQPLRINLSYVGHVIPEGENFI